MAFGFHTTDGVDWNELWYGVLQPATVMYNEDKTDFEGTLSAPIGEQWIKLYHRGSADYTLMSQLSKPIQQDIAKGRFRPEPKFWGLGKGFTWQYLVENTSADVVEANSQQQFTDREFMRKHALAPGMVAPGTTTTLFGWWDGNFKSEEGINTPPDFGVHTFTAAHTHYVGTGSPTASGVMLEDLSAAKKHIREHGHFGSLTGYFSDLQMQQLELLALPLFDRSRRAGTVGVALPATDGSISDIGKFENSLSQEVIRSGIRGSLMGIDNMVETAYMVDNYFLLVETGGPMKPLFKQQKTNTSAQGLILFPGDAGAYPIQNSLQFRWHKFGVRMRSAGVVYQIGAAAASYSTPTVYTAVNY